ncbi:MAG: hypothetical protein ACI4TX_02255 [Christensenellales bacterium]
MTRVNKKLYLILFVALISFITATLCIAPFSKQGKVYAALDESTLLSKQSNIVNNVILFAFKDDESQVINGSNYTSDVFDFVNNFDNIANKADDSLQTYYKSISNGKLTIHSNLVKDDNGTPNDTSDDKPFVVILDNNMSYYSGSTDIEREIINKVLTSLNNSSTTVILDSSADSNKDGILDNLTFLYLDFETRETLNAETDQKTAISTLNKFSGSAWPHRTSALSAVSFTLKGNVYKFNQYLMFGSFFLDLKSPLKTFNSYIKSTYFHEMGHGLGLPDLYLTGSNVDSTHSYVGEWDLMATNYMQSINEYFKHRLGWTNDENYKEITNQGTYTLKASNTNEINTKLGRELDLTSPLALYIKDDNYPNQYIVIEYKNLDDVNGYDNILNNLLFVGNAKALKSGIIIYRVNENYDGSFSKILDSNETNKASIFFFRDGSISDTSYCAFGAGTTFGIKETTASSQSNINTPYISFVNSSGNYVNSNIIVTVNSIDSNGARITISGGDLIVQNSSTTGETENSPTHVKDLITDTNLFNALSEQFADILPDDLTVEDLEGLSELNLANKGITDLTGLGDIYMPSLRTLILNGNKITTGLDEISSFTSLINLQMADCGLTDISFIAPLSNLAYVNFSINEISNFAQLNPSTKTNLVFANLILNDLDLYNSNNAFLLSGGYDDKFAIGIQGFPKDTTNIGACDIYYNSNGLTSTTTLTLENNSITVNLEQGINTLSDGKYRLNYRFSDNAIAVEVNKTIIIDVIVVTLKKPLVELLVGDYYENDTTASFNGWKNSYSFTATTTYNGTIVDYVDTLIAGTYFITFRIYVNDNTSFEITKKVIVYNNQRIAFGADGIVDEKLYTQLLTLVGKTPTIEGNESIIGTNSENSIYEQDLYFYDILGKGDEITELSFANKNITDLTGITLLNLGKIITINFNQNSITDISPLFTGGNEALPKLENLYLANMGLGTLPTEIGTMYTLKKIDLSFNKLVRVDALKPLVLPQLLESAGKKQSLELVNLNMNNISFSTSGAWIEDSDNNSYIFIEDANYYEFNYFIKDTTQVEGYKAGDEIFIVLIQNLPNYVSYMNYPTFEYYHTSANTFIKNGKVEYRFIISVNGANKMDEWLTHSTKDTITTAGMYTVNFKTNGSNPFALALSTKYNRVFYLSTVSLKSLKEINQKDYTLEDIWLVENEYSILSTERIKNPSINDLNISSSIPNVTYNYSDLVIYIYYLSGDIYHQNPQQRLLDLDNASSYEIESYDYTITIRYSISALGVVNGVTLKTYQSINLVYTVKIKRNYEVQIEDAQLDAKIRSVLRKSNTEPLYAYDTYKLTRLDLSNAGISDLNNTTNTKDFTDFKFDNLISLNLSKNNLTYLGLTGFLFKSLKYLDISYNSLTDSTELKSIQSNVATLYILAFMNLYTLDNDVNTWLITNNVTKLCVFTGIQGINSTTVDFITFDKDVISADGTTAGFYFVDSKMDYGTYKIAYDGTFNDYIASFPTYHYNFYHYYKDAGQYSLTLNFTFEDFNFKYQGIVNHGKAYVDLNNRTYTLDYDKNNNQAEIDKALKYDFVIYENCDASDFTFSYLLYKDDILIDNLYSNELTTFSQTYTIIHNASKYGMYYTKTIYVVDREAPVITMSEGYEIIKTTINQPYSYYQNGKIDKDIKATDNYDNADDIQIVAEVRDSKNNLLSNVFVDLGKPDTYTITYYAIDSSGNESEHIVRKVRIDYKNYETIKLTKPASLIYIGNSSFKVTVYRNDASRDPNPTFYWYVDGIFCKTSTPDDSSNAIVISSTTDLPLTSAGEHTIEVRINENNDPDYEIATQTNSISYFVLLDTGVLSSLHYVAIAIILIIIIYNVVKLIAIRKKNENYQKYEYNIISKK